MKKKAFTLVELIVVITILAILGTIAFISLSGYSKEARDSKRITDTSNLLSKINVENVRGINMSELINPLDKKTNILTINSKKEDGLQGYPNFNALMEAEENFLDPKSKHRYPFAYAIGGEGKESYNFMQMATVSEKDGRARLVGNYYKFNDDTDSPSLFVQDGKDGNDIDNDYIVDNGEVPPYDIGVPVTPKPEEKYSCKGTLPQNTQISNTNNLIEDTQYQNTNENNNCYYFCNTNYVWNMSRTACIIPTGPNDCIEDGTFWNGVECAINPNKDWVFSDNNKLSFSKEGYPGCDTPNIILTDGIDKYEIAACNVGASMAGIHSDCNFSETLNLKSVNPNSGYGKDCSTNKLGLHFQWGKNKGIKLEEDPTQNWDTINSTLEIWNGTEVCGTGYYIPSQKEWESIVNLGLWGNKGLILGKDLFLPLISIRGYSTGILEIQGQNAHYWSSNSFSTSKTDSLNIRFSNDEIKTTNNSGKDYAFAIRCIKN